MNRRTFALAAAALPLPFLATARAQQAATTTTPIVLQPLGRTADGRDLVASQTVLPNTNVIDAIGGLREFAEFSDLVQRAGLTETLRGAGPFTVLAPTNEAIRRIPAGLLNQLNPNNITASQSVGSSNPDIFRLEALINMHIIPGRYQLADFTGTVQTVRTRNGNAIEIGSRPGEEYRIRMIRDAGFGIGGVNYELRSANFVNPQMICSNGAVLPINTPIIQ
jgi:uncharacterized surface protein with fasciclin (FAS1) repeats